MRRWINQRDVLLTVDRYPASAWRVRLRKWWQWWTTPIGWPQHPKGTR